MQRACLGYDPCVEVPALATLEDVLAWCRDVVEVIVQDEFTHDVIVQRPAGFVVFDTT